MRPKKDKHINVALETDTYDKLVMLAIEDKRNVSNFVRHIIKRYMQGVADGSITLSTYTMFHKRS